MAGDWIKMRSDLQSHPKIVRILSATSTDKFRVIGGLHAVWSVFDAHSVDGALVGYTPELMDHVIGWPGFSAAMNAVDWLHYDNVETLTLPEFDAHNGQSAKRRAEDQKRKRQARNSVRNVSHSNEDILRTKSGLEREKRREEKIKDQKILSASADRIPFDEIVSAYHGALPMLPHVRTLTASRKTKLKARWHESAERQSIGYWRSFWDHVAKSNFLTGRSGKWTACGFDWLLEPSNHTKVVEGNYDNRDNA